MQNTFYIFRAMIFSLGSIIALTFFTACGSEYVFEKEYPIANQAWAYADTLDFQFDIVDTTIVYNIFLEVEHSTSYSKQNLYTQIYTKFPTGERLKEQLSLELANKMGKWNGNCSSDWCTVRIPIQEGAFFNQAGNYTITVEQFMRVNPIEGIKSVGLLLEDTENRR